MVQRLANVLVRANTLPADLVGNRAVWIESMKGSKKMFTADSLPTREGAMSVLTAFEVTGQIPEATKMNPDGLIDPRFVRKALEKYR